MTVAVRIIALSVLLLVGYNCAFSAAAPATSLTKPKTYLVRHENVSDAKGMLAYALDDGTTQTKKGTLAQNDDGTGFVMNQEGSYSFITPEDVNVKMSYMADKNGFMVKGLHPL